LILRLPFILELPSALDRPEILGFIALTSLQGAWFALLFQRLAQLKAAASPEAPSLRRPRTWGAVGTVGVTLSLVTATVAVWLVVVALPTFGGHGPDGPWAVLIALVLGLVAFLGLLGLAVERARNRLASH
jgi:hypothetical protein